MMHNVGNMLIDDLYQSPVMTGRDDDGGGVDFMLDFHFAGENSSFRGSRIIAGSNGLTGVQPERSSGLKSRQLRDGIIIIWCR